MAALTGNAAILAPAKAPTDKTMATAAVAQRNAFIVFPVVTYLFLPWGC